MTDKEKKANKLEGSASPYLLQHAYNPVNWYPWGKEALDRAKGEDKPILVSIGYSACHWCHVMEHESFEDNQTASLMNKYFVCIKVDREERPDIDNIYMEAIQAMGLQGGWPLNVFLTPDQKPFYGGTYFPKSGWQQLLQSVAEAFEKNREKLEESAEKFRETLIMDEVKKYQLTDFSPGYDKELIDSSAAKLIEKVDSVYGGMRKAPKFPMPSIWFFLLRQYFLTKDSKYLDAVTLTLDKISNGGIYDHLEGGFARYSVDEKWFAPHFEKMLYDNGQLLALYSEAYMQTKKSSYKDVIERTIEWMQSNMLSPEGGFYSALDADSEGVEGKYYVWEASEIDRLLGEKSELFKSYFDVKDTGNWENGVNILYNSKDFNDFLDANDLTEKAWKEFYETGRKILLKSRNERVKPGLDNKILAGWNGLALTGIIKAYQATQNESYLKLATATAEFVQGHLIDTNGKITRVYGSEISGVLEDYAFIIDGFINLYQSGFNKEWLNLAQKLTEYTLTNFFDEENGMFFFTDSNDHELIARKKEIFDNVIPSSNSQMAENLRKLGLLLEKQEWVEISMKMVLQVKKFIKNDVEYMSNWACTYLAFTQPAAEIAILGPELKSMSLDLHSHYLPFKLIVGDTEKNEALPLLKNRIPIDGKTTIYVCFDKACKLPVQSIEDALNQLPGLEPTGT